MKNVPMNTVIKDFEGNPLKEPDGKSKETKPIRIGSLLINALGRFSSPMGEEVILSYHLGLKLHQIRTKNGPSVELENAEFSLLQKALEQNGSQYVALVLGQALCILKESENSKVDKKKKPK